MLQRRRQPHVTHPAAVAHASLLGIRLPSEAMSLAVADAPGNTHHHHYSPSTPCLQACKEAIADALDDAASMGTRGDAVDSRPGRHSVAARVKAVGVSGQQHGLVALDKDHTVIRPGEEGQSAGHRTGAAARHARHPSLKAGCAFARPPVQPSCGAMWRAQRRRRSCPSSLASRSCPPSRVRDPGHRHVVAPQHLAVRS